MGNGSKPTTHRFKWKNGEDFTPEKIDKLGKKDNSGYLLEFDVRYAKVQRKNHNELPFKLGKKDKRGYLLEVDVRYPKELRKNHNELPILVEKMKIWGRGGGEGGGGDW